MVVKDKGRFARHCEMKTEKPFENTALALGVEVTRLLDNVW